MSATVDFDLSDDQVALRDAARDLLDKLAPPERVRQADGFDADLWRAMVDQGWLDVESLGLSAHGRLRQPAYRGLRPDLAPTDLTAGEAPEADAAAALADDLDTPDVPTTPTVDTKPENPDGR